MSEYTTLVEGDGKTPLTLGEIIKALDHPALYTYRVLYDFGRISPRRLSSYRGYYEQLALEYDTDPPMTVQEILRIFCNAPHTRFSGYKGGSYFVDEGTPVWAANWGESTGVAIVGIDSRYGSVYLRTSLVD